MSGLAFSFLNKAIAATLGLTSFTEAETAVGVRHPERPHLRAFTPDLSGGAIVLDFSVATVLEVVALIHANFTSATIQGNATNSWGAPSYTQAITLARAGNRRYHYALRPVAFNYRYLRVNVPTQSTTDGATRFALGGIWAGLITSPPRDIRMEPVERLVHARKDVETEDGRRIQRIKLDDPCWWFTAKRHAENDTKLEAWREIDRQWADADNGGAALVLMNSLEPSNCYVMRRADDADEWPNSRIWSEGQMEAFEVIAG